MSKAYIRPSIIEAIANDMALHMDDGANDADQVAVNFDKIVTELEAVAIPLAENAWPGMAPIRLSNGLAVIIQPHEWIVDTDEVGIVPAPAGLIIPG